MAKINPTNTVLDKVQDFVSRYVQVGDDEKLVIGLWILHTWTFSESVPNPYTTPYLYVHSAERRSGKTRLLEVTETLVRNPLRAANATSAVLFRSFELLSPTLLLDEVDAIWSGAKNEEMRGVLNAGYKRGGSVLRVEDKEPKAFNCFAPKALAGIDNGQLPDTVRDRCIPIHMHRQKEGSSEAFYSFDVEDEVFALTAEIGDWIISEYPKVAGERPKPIEGISDRAWEISMPLIALAHWFGPEIVKKTKAALKRLLTVEETLSPTEQLLADIRDLFEEMKSNTLPADLIVERTGLSSGKLLANMLRPHGPKPTVVRFRGQGVRGYYKRDF